MEGHEGRAHNTATAAVGRFERPPAACTAAGMRRYARRRRRDATRHRGVDQRRLEASRRSNFFDDRTNRRPLAQVAAFRFVPFRQTVDVIFIRVEC